MKTTKDFGEKQRESAFLAHKGTVDHATIEIEILEKIAPRKTVEMTVLVKEGQREYTTIEV